MKIYPSLPLSSLLSAFLLLLPACSPDDGEMDPPSTDSPNILLIIADDLGKDALTGFPEGSTKPVTPNLDELRTAGLSFTNAWVNPTCSPTRASIITGKYGYRTGVKWANDILDPSETILQKYINDETNDTYGTALIGKWHLSGESPTINPESFGLDYYAGLIRGAVQDYYQWQLTEDGNGSLQTEYITEVLTDLSIDWIDQQAQPWFLWLAYNAPHTPFHVPPTEMHSQGNLPDYEEGMDPLPYYLAAIEAMDFQIGLLLDALPEAERENTVILFLGDNGSPVQVAQAPYGSDRAKGTLYQGGINVPFFVSGKGVSRSGTDASLITNTDLFATIAALAGAEVSEINDSRSFATLLAMADTHRDFQYTEMDDGTTDGWTISNGAYKLLIDANGTEEFYNLTADPYESTNLLDGTLSAEAATAKAALEGELANIRE